MTREETKRTVEIPDRIYLQIDPEDENLDRFHKSEITWCQDQINDYDVEYIRADKYFQLLKFVKEVASYQAKGKNIQQVASHSIRFLGNKSVEAQPLLTNLEGEKE